MRRPPTSSLPILVLATLGAPLTACVDDVTVEDSTMPVSMPGAEEAYPDVPGELIELDLPVVDGTIHVTGRKIDDDHAVVMGDIVVDLREFRSNLYATGVASDRRWPNGVVPFRGLDDRVHQAVIKFNGQSDLRLRLLGDDEDPDDYIQFEFDSDGGCSSSDIGRDGGEQTIHLAPECDVGAVLHEIGHAVGLSHEHNRRDRNNFIRVSWGDIQDGKESQFEIIDDDDRFEVGDIDFGSIMMYGSFAFCRPWPGQPCNRPTMTRLDGTTWSANRTNLSDRDRGSLWWMYRGANTSSIRAKYDALGGASRLGYPLTGEYRTPDRTGYYIDLPNDASIYWSRGSGAVLVSREIRSRWRAIGGTASAIGYPTSDPTTLIPTLNQQAGTVSHFQRGSIYWNPATGAQEIYGLIRAKWDGLGGYRSSLGYPTTGERAASDNVGRYNSFQGGSIYYYPTTGTWVLSGAIRTKWIALGSERSCLGYPTGDAGTVFDLASGTSYARQTFQRGTITSYSDGRVVSSCSAPPN